MAPTRFALSAALLLALTACAPTIIYNPRDPGAQTRPLMEPLEAVITARELLNTSSWVQPFSGIVTVDSIGPKEYAFHIDYPTDPGYKPHSAYTYGNPDGIHVQGDNYAVPMTPTAPAGWPNHPEDAIRFVDALHSLEVYFTTDHAAVVATELKAFAPVAADYRAQKTKPAIPEEVRRFQIQAERNFGQKRYAESVRFYRQSLAIAPWWPEGHYNAANLLAEIGLMPEAILEMKKYLMLAPESPDARQAQDKIYAWETQGK